jgi:ribonuclease J
MAKLKIISLGGLNEIGKNLTVFEYAEDIFIVDCGIAFPDNDMYGIDAVIPDVTYLEKNQHRIRGLILTHGHEDHIGGIPYIFRQINVPIYATKLTAGLVNAKLEENHMQDNVIVHTVEAGQTIKLGCFKIEFIHVNHSIADAVALAIKTPVGTVVHTGDFKIDTTPIQGGMADLTRFGELGNKGVLALLMDSTNAEKPGYSDTESKVGHSFDSLFHDCKERIIVTTFASNVHRIQQVINCAEKYGRKVCVTGRSMENILRVAVDLGYMNIPEGILVDITKIKGLPKDKIVIITTGSQGETMSALYRIAFSGHKNVEIKAGDRVIISASAVPGNEKTIGKVINELLYKGADVIYDKFSDIHVSGHACQEELKMILALVKPKYFIPVHGEHRHLRNNAALAQQMGIQAKNIIISDIGKVIELSGRSVKIAGEVPSGRVMVDGTGVGDVGSVVLRDRKHLAQDGMLVVVLNVSAEDGSLISGPDIITRGFIYVKESEELISELKEISIEALDSCAQKNITDWATLKGTVKARLSDHLYKKTKRNPMILPVIMEI